MDHALLVGVADGLGDLLEDREQPTALENRVEPIEHSVRGLFQWIPGMILVGGRSIPLLQHVLQRAAADELHGEEGSSIGERADTIDRWNAGVLQSARDACLIEEAPRGRGIGGILGQENLHRDFTSQVEVAGAVDDTHSARADLAEQLIPRRNEHFVSASGCARTGAVQVNVPWLGSGG